MLHHCTTRNEVYRIANVKLKYSSGVISLFPDENLFYGIHLLTDELQVGNYCSNAGGSIRILELRLRLRFMTFHLRTRKCLFSEVVNCRKFAEKLLL